MTARLAAHPDVETRAAETLERMIAAGVDVELVAGSGTAADPMRGLRESVWDLVLVGAQALRGTSVEGLTLLAVFPRGDPRDALVVAGGAPAPLRELPAGARVGVAGPRRSAFLRAHRADLDVVAVESGAEAAALLESAERLDAAVLGAGEAHRTGLTDRIGEMLDPRSWLPAPGQGAVALVARHPIAEITALDHLPTRTALRAELALLDALDVPPEAAVGCLAQPSGRLLRLWAGVASADGRRLVRADMTGPLDEPEPLGTSVARELTRRGAGLVRSGAA